MLLRLCLPRDSRRHECLQCWPAGRQRSPRHAHRNTMPMSDRPLFRFLRSIASTVSALAARHGLRGSLAAGAAWMIVLGAGVSPGGAPSLADTGSVPRVLSDHISPNASVAVAESPPGLLGVQVHEARDSDQRGSTRDARSNSGG